MSATTHSQFARFEDRVDETIDRQIARLETRLEPLAHVVRDLAVFEDRRAGIAARLVEAEREWSGTFERAEARTSTAADRLDRRLVDLVKAHNELEAKVDRYVQRYVGVSVAAAAGWAVFSHFVKLP